MDSTTLQALLALIAGYLLKEFEAIIGKSRENKKVINKALVTLLEVRHMLLSRLKVMEALKTQLNITDIEVMVLRPYFDNAYKISPKLIEEYESAISVISGIDPLLGFHFSNRHSLDDFLKQINQHAIAAGPEHLPFFSEANKVMEIFAKEQMTESILALAKHSSWITYFQIKKYLNTPLPFPPESQEVLNMLKKGMPAKSSTS